MAGAKVKPPLEKEVQKAICEWLELKGIFFWRSNNTPVFGRGGDNQQGALRFRALPKYTPRGLPDLIAVRQGGMFVALEVKRPGAQLKPDQVKFAERVNKIGGEYHVVRSVDDVQAIFS